MEADPDLARKLGLPEGLDRARTAADVDALLGAQGDPPPPIPDPYEVSCSWACNAARVVAAARDFVEGHARRHRRVAKPRDPALRRLVDALELHDEDNRLLLAEMGRARGRP